MRRCLLTTMSRLENEWVDAGPLDAAVVVRKMEVMGMADQCVPQTLRVQQIKG